MSRQLPGLRSKSKSRPDAGNDPCRPDDLRRCFTDDPPPREGRCFLGFDFGEATSSTAACAVWPATGRMETWQAFGDTPSLVERQRRDSAPYVAMEARGELRTYPGRIVRLEMFLADLQADLAGCRVAAAAADSYKDSARSAIFSTGRRCAGLSSSAASVPARMAGAGRAGVPATCASAQVRDG